MTVQASELMTPYSTVAPYFGAPPTWLTEMDAQRIMSYQIYEQIYWNVPETFVLQQRGSDADPIYIPTGRTIIDTTNRYVGKDFGFMIDPDVGTPAGQVMLQNALTALFRRERFWSTFASNKRFGLVRGDWLFHVLANPAKPEGRRITIETVDPGAYFPVYHPDDPAKVIAVHIAEQFVDPDDSKTYIKRQTYYRGSDPLENDGSDTSIWNSVALYDPKSWEDITVNPKTVISDLTQLPPQITSIPVYHIRNFETPGDPFGSSELRGFERIIAAVNQAISDEELALALEGLGMYATDGGPPRDEQGNITDWILGPGNVVEHKGKFQRVTGVGSVTPVLDHVRFLIDSLSVASGTPEAATGKVDVNVAESGISLILQMGPMLSKVSEKEQVITDVMRQMYFDITTGFLPAYEGITSDAYAEPSYGNVLPDDKAAQIKEILEIVAAGLADAEWGRTEIARIRGYDFGNGMAARVLSEQAERAAATDPFAARMAAESEQEGAQ
jgi:Phage portal protein, SPP1 Gp6-like.